MIKCDRPVELSTGERIGQNNPMSLENLKKIKVTDNLICNVYHKKNTQKSMQCE